jgi:hypothetical protein
MAAAMADKPSVNPFPGSLRANCSEDLDGSGGLASEVEIRLRSTEKVKVVLQRCGRNSAPHHLLVRIRETLISITTTPRDRPPHSH